jgi:hypothetical protein
MIGAQLSEVVINFTYVHCHTIPHHINIEFLFHNMDRHLMLKKKTSNGIRVVYRGHTLYEICWLGLWMIWKSAKMAWILPFSPFSEKFQLISKRASSSKTQYHFIWKPTTFNYTSMNCKSVFFFEMWWKECTCNISKATCYLNFSVFTIFFIFQN